MDVSSPILHSDPGRRSPQTSRQISQPVSMGYRRLELVAKIQVLALVQLFPDNADNNLPKAPPPISCVEYHRHK
jgi:hypothetical protein